MIIFIGSSNIGRNISNNFTWKVEGVARWTSRECDTRRGLLIGLLFAVSILPHTSAVYYYLTSWLPSLFINYTDCSKLICILYSSSCSLVFCSSSHILIAFNGSAFRTLLLEIYHVWVGQLTLVMNYRPYSFPSNRKYALKKNVNDVLEPSEIIESERRIDLSLFSTVTKSK